MFLENTNRKKDGIVIILAILIIIYTIISNNYSYIDIITNIKY